MSADNGIYVLVTPTVLQEEVKEYRVVHAQAIENIYYYKEGTKLREAELVKYFGNAFVFKHRENALVVAHDMAKKCTILEYGVCEIVWPTVFPTMTMEEAERILKEEYNRVFEEVQPCMYKKREGVDYLLYVSEEYK